VAEFIFQEGAEGAICVGADIPGALRLAVVSVIEAGGVSGAVSMGALGGE
jgi:hypothetical protein